MLLTSVLEINEVSSSKTLAYNCKIAWYYFLQDYNVTSFTVFRKVYTQNVFNLVVNYKLTHIFEMIMQEKLFLMFG